MSRTEAAAADRRPERNGRPYETVIGLEVHVELKTESKIFCACPADFGASPNSRVCPVCLGLPGVLPVLNERALEQAVRAAVALNCRVRTESKFDRKNYHYPDLPKGYQISQYDLPLGYDGHLELEGEDGASRRVGIRRVHLEEDTGKSLHDQAEGASVLDYNRAGVPLLEIVSEPDLRSPEEARSYLERLRLTMLHTGVSDVRMEEGSLRVDCNVSVRPAGSRRMGTITEIKNLNSFRSAVRALAYEGERQWRVLSEGGALERETRHWDERGESTFPSRSKEEVHDYRYFPEPDLLPVRIEPAWTERIRAALPELPEARSRRYVQELGLERDAAELLAADPDLARYFEDAVEAGAAPASAARWVTGEVQARVKAEGRPATELEAGPASLAALIREVDAGTVSLTAAKDVFEEMCRSGAGPAAIIEARGLRQISDEQALAEVVERIVAEHPGPVEDYRSGKKKAIGFLVGQVMRETRGRANPQLVNRLLRDRLG